MDVISLDYVNACKVLLKETKHYTLVLVGCGGTGSWLAPSIARIGKLLSEKFDVQVDIRFVDPDVVEAKNCYRQNFCQAEIGLNKADVLAFRYGLAWGIDIKSYAEKFGEKVLDGHGSTCVLIGCVDNAAARRDIARLISGSDRWWLDAGNHHAAGQVAIGAGFMSKGAFDLPGYCTSLPHPGKQHPDLLEDTQEGGEQVDDLSCADLALQDSQGLAINQRIAAEATDYLVRLLLTRDLVKMATYIDLASGTTRSKYITRENVMKIMEAA